MKSNVYCWMFFCIQGDRDVTYVTVAIKRLGVYEHAYIDRNFVFMRQSLNTGDIVWLECVSFTSSTIFLFEHGGWIWYLILMCLEGWFIFLYIYLSLYHNKYRRWIKDSSKHWMIVSCQDMASLISCALYCFLPLLPFLK